MDKRDKISTEKIIKAIKENYGIVSDAAAKLKITRQCLHNWINNEPELKAAVKEARENELKDLIEGSLIKNIKSGKEVSIIFAAKTLLRDRGYQEQITIKDDSKLQEQINSSSESELLEMIDRMTKRIKDAS